MSTQLDILKVIKMVSEKKLKPEEVFGEDLFNQELVINNVHSTNQDLVYLNSDWIEEKIDDKDKGSLSGNIIIFDKNEEVFNELKNSTLIKDGKIVLVKPGLQYEQLNESVFIIDPSNKENFKELFKNLTSNNIFPNNIAFLWTKNSSIIGVSDIENNLTEGIYSILYLTQGIMTQKSKDKVKLINLYKTEQDENPFGNAVSGFAKNLKIENPSYDYRTIGVLDVDHTITDKKLCHLLIDEFNNTDKIFEVKYHHSKRYVKKLVEIDNKNIGDSKQALKEKGVYIITGGAGGLGLIFAKYLAEKYKARLVLTGRSELKKDRQDKIDELREYGSEVYYIQSDISKKSDVQLLISKTKEYFGEINGVIHSAGVLRDSYIITKDKNKFEDVLKPKIYGTLCLDELIGNEELDIFVLFSSTTGLTGNVGQCDYAYANSFMDNFATYREGLLQQGLRKGRTLSINWPLWKDGGMNVDEQSEKLLFNMFGMTPLKTNNALQGFENMLNSTLNQAAIIEGDKEKILDKFNAVTLKHNNVSQQNVSSDITDTKNIEENLKKDLLEIVSTILKIDDMTEIDIDNELTQYGFDSISYTAFSNIINEKYDLAIMPSLFYEYPSLDKFIKYITKNHTGELAKYYIKSNKITKTVAQNTEIEERDSNQLQTLLKSDLLDIVSTILKIDTSEIETDNDLTLYGFDSISYTAFSNIINEKYDLTIMPSIFYEYPSLDGFITYLYENFKESIINSYDYSKQNNKQKTSSVHSKNKSNIKKTKNYFRTTKKTRKKETSVSKDVELDPIAIIGMNGIMPNSKDLDEFWDNLLNGVNMISEVPKDRWDWEEYFGDPIQEENKTNCKYGGFMKEVDKFDASFFGISPREAELMDPQQRIFLEVVWKTIEDAGYNVSELSGTDTGLFVGVGTWDYYDLLKENGVDIEAQTATGICQSILANRISYLLNFQGPSEPIDTACSSSLIAIHRAIQSIRSGDCEMAIAGGVNVIASPLLYISFSKAGMLNTNGMCKTFDKDANGYVRSEGAGAILLKPLSKALKDKDNIYGIIKGTSINHGGKSNSLTAPNPSAQANVIIKAWEKADIKPTEISYIEAHGTGTKLGDPIEIDGIKKAFDESFKKYNLTAPDRPYCGIGSVKSNMGHAETAAGIAGVFKILLSLKHKKIPQNLHFEELNPYIQIKDSPLYITNNNTTWKSLIDENGNEIPRVAGISSFGFGGVNAHIVIEEFDNNTLMTEEDDKQQCIVLSAKDKDRLLAYAQDLSSYLKENFHSNNTQQLDFKPNAQVKDEILSIIAETLDIQKENISKNDKLFDIGFDATLFSHLIELLNEIYNIKLTGVEFDNNFNVLELVKQIELTQRTVETKSKVDSFNEKLTLKNIAFTLQVGRKHMQERLAIITSSIEDLIYKLDSFAKNKTQLGVLYKSYDKYKNKYLSQYDEDLNETVIKWFEKGKINRIAELWINNVWVDWSILWKDLDAKRVSLPTYPFERNRYWFQSKKEVSTQERILEKSQIKISNELENTDVKDDSITTSNVSVKEYIFDLLSKTLKISKDHLKEDMNLSEIGADSILMLQVCKNINNKLHINMDIRDMYEDMKINEIIKYVKNEVEEASVEEIPETSNNDNLVIDDIINMTSKLTKINTDKIDEETSIEELGLDSILMLQMTKRLTDKYNLVIKNNDLNHIKTVGEISEYIIANIG